MAVRRESLEPASGCRQLRRVVRRSPVPPLVAAALLALCGCPGPRDDGPIRIEVKDGSGQGTGAQQAGSTRELAEREGELAWYTSLPEDGARVLLDRFKGKYDFISTRLVRESTFDIIRRIRGEIDGGKVQADVLHVLDVAIFVQLKKGGALLAYQSPEARTIAAQYKDAGGWVALRCVDLCIAYDSARMSAAEAPKYWSDLLDEKWIGRVAQKDGQTAGSAYAQYYFLREEYGLSYWQRMARRQSPRIYKTADESIEALRRGDVDLVSGAMGYSVWDATQRGSSIRGVWPEDGVPMMIGPTAILREAPHPNAAKLFTDFVLSKEGQEALQSAVGPYSPRPDVHPPQGLPDLADMPLMAPEAGWDEYAEKQAALQSEYTRLFHPGSE